MTHATYTVGFTAKGWIIRHDGQASPPYELVEAAFEEACAAATLALKNGMDVTVNVERALHPDSGFGRQPLGEAMVRAKAG